MLGPGLLWAGAAIGVSHIVQSTKAGADYGFALIGIVILANILKYPFFEVGPRYATATGKTLLTGYKELGNWAFILYLILTFLTVFTIQAAVTLVTAGVISWFFGGIASPVLISIILLIVCAVILAFGHYALLDKMVKIIILLLTITTFIALFAAAKHYSPENLAMPAPELLSKGGLLFIVALIGWMPAPIDITVWSSIWTVEKRKEDPEATTLRNALIDFKVGYIATIFIAIGFLTLGALVMYGTGQHFSPKGAVFAGQFIDLYTATIGPWSKYLIAFAALATMFSTTITCIDAYGRVFSKSQSLIYKGSDEDESTYYYWIIVVIVGTILLITGLSASMKLMVTIATTLSFITAPVLAILNYKVITSKLTPVEAHPPLWIKVLSWTGIFFLLCFTILYVKVTYLNA